MITINQGETVLTHFKAVRRRQGRDIYMFVCFLYAIEALHGD